MMILAKLGRALNRSSAAPNVVGRLANRSGLRPHMGFGKSSSLFETEMKLLGPTTRDYLTNSIGGLRGGIIKQQGFIGFRAPSYTLPLELACSGPTWLFSHSFSLQTYSKYIWLKDWPLVRLFVIAYLGYVIYDEGFHVKKIHFEELEDEFLTAGLISRIEVYEYEKTVAKVYLNTGDVKGDHAKNYYYVWIPTRETKSFEEKLEKAQEALGIDPDDFIPITQALVSPSTVRMTLAYLAGALI